MKNFEDMMRSDLEQRLIELRHREWEIDAERQYIKREIRRRKMDQFISTESSPRKAYFLDLPIEYSGASVRLTNALLNLGCRTLRDSERLKEWQVAEYPGVGASTLRELRSLLKGGAPRLSGTQMRAIRAYELQQSGKTLAEVSCLLDVGVARAGQLTHEGYQLERRSELLKKLQEEDSSHS